MMKLFNSTFEVSLRVILMLSTIPDKNMTLDRIVAYDFMAIYGGYFGFSENNLHGENNYGFSEYSTRRGIVQEALKALVSDGLIKATRQNKLGFCYEINPAGVTFSNNQQTDYAVNYRQIIKKVHRSFMDKTEIELMNEISKKSRDALRR